MQVNLQKIAELAKPISKKNLFMSIFIGGAISGFVSLIVNACLLQVTINAFFTTVKKLKINFNQFFFVKKFVEKYGKNLQFLEKNTKKVFY